MVLVVDVVLAEVVVAVVRGYGSDRACVPGHVSRCGRGCGDGSGGIMKS